jgi:large subunit ribosomal protein L18e
MRINVEREDIKDWLKQLKSVPREDKYKGLWNRVLELSEVPARSRKSVNIFKINKHSEAGDMIIVPGKVLSEGKMEHKITITAMEYSAGALSRLKEAQCTVKKLDEMLKEKRIKLIV